VSVGDAGLVAFIGRASAAMWDAGEGRVSRTPWEQANVWTQRRYLRMAEALHTAGWLVDPAIGRDLNTLQRSRDEWRGRAKAAENVAALDRERANAAARESSAARTDAEAFLQLANDGREELEDARDRADRLQRVVDLVETLVTDEVQATCHVAKSVLDIIRRDVP
jgi:hypothetical protein